ncbi:MAG: 3-hydroxyacyl-CoA dehydrogenase family protein [Dehalococcoidaceae bacterium]|nr:3-hydroxyacyl-CoA dehydrogenase family protein [Dehalococcoidaceae bacterium]
MDINTIGITGLGIMGRGIAEASLAAGYHVTVTETDHVSLEKNLDTLSGTLQRLARLKRFPVEIAGSLSERLTGSSDLEALSKCDLVIEAIPEDLEGKKELFRRLDEVCIPRTILATNTSCLPVTEIGSLAGRKDKILGIHFFNPVSLMKLVELIKTPRTSPETLETATRFIESLNKTAVIAPDTPGFIVNRLLLAFLSEAMRLHEMGVSTEDIDRAVTLGLNHPMGPFKLADFVGLDTALYIARSMQQQLNASHFTPPATLEKLVNEGKLGRKTGEGFYRY